IKQQNFCFEYWLQHAHIADRMVGIVAGLKLFQQFAIVVKTRLVAPNHQFAERSDRQVCLPNPAWTHQQKSCLPTSRIISGKCLHDKFGLGQAAIPRSPFLSAFPDVRLEVFEIAMLVPPRDAGASQTAACAVSLRTIAGHRPGKLGGSDRSSRSGVLALDNALGLPIRVYPFDQTPASSAAQRTLRFSHNSRA